MNVLTAGKSKKGKSYAIATLPGTIVVLNQDPGGYEAIRRERKIFPPGDADEVLKFFEDKDNEDIVAIIDYSSSLNTISTDMGGKIRSLGLKGRFQNFINDSNVLMDSPIQNIILDGYSGIGTTSKGWVMANNNLAKMTQPAWGEAIEKILEITDTLSSVCKREKKNFIATAHLQMVQDNLVGGVKEQILIYGKQLPEQLLGFFDTVLLCEYKFDKFCWRTHPTDTFETIGSRLYDNLPEFIEQDFGALISGKFKEVGGKNK